MFVRNVVSSLAAALIMGFVLFTQRPEEITAKERDFARITQENYQLVYLSMYSEEYASGFPFEMYMGWDTYTAKHSIGDLQDLTDYVDTTLSNQEGLIQIFTLVDPAKISEGYGNNATAVCEAYRQTLCKSVQSRPEVEFVFMLPAYSMEYWSRMEETQVQECLDSYLLFLDELKHCGNARIYFFGHCQWLTGNPANYESLEDLSTDILTRMIALSIFNDKYQVKDTESLRQKLDELQGQILQQKTEPEEKCDMSQYEMVFFGDSNLANYSGPLSVTGIVEALTGATTYNCGVGGLSAANYTGDDVTTGFETTVSYFMGDKTDAFAGHTQFCSEVERFRNADHTGKKLVFFLGYGTNDYFFGTPLENPEDPYDVTTYKGALNKAIERLKEAYPQAEIVVNVPIFTAAFGNGQDINSDVGGTLADYVDGAVQTATGNGLPYINHYIRLPMNELNYATYLEDGVHLSEHGRYEYAKVMIDFMKNHME